DIIIPDSTGNAMKAKLVYVRNHSNRKDWVCFVCTDMTLDEEKILRAYTMRWKIETYFKMSKSYLKLRTECHSTSYDAITSHMVIVAIRYMILAIERFQNTDNRSLEEL
ncbi:transposase, partial [Sporofaciens sp. JLR.KK001]